MREAIGLADKSIDILSFIDALNSENQVVAKRKIADVEEKAMVEMVSIIIISSSINVLK